MAQYAVLRQLADHPEVSSAELARLCFVTRQWLGEVLAELRRAGLVTVGEGASGRVRPVRLSDTRRARPADVEDRMLAGLGDGDRRRLAELLARCADNLTPGGGSPAGR
ncbi:MarR family winged helix-turn-helix transcriptional regulator [Amycolatopsis methanolica]|uniref:MarR family winged helix-turn-helix transcriptional regulator n=1 Tax=Amycolatopsis methanolica TaxID=1814 RepID=UPI00035E9724|nr:helix-turn-helix domain-containing protein [Amycolatopsis methanolica]